MHFVLKCINYLEWSICICVAENESGDAETIFEEHNVKSLFNKSVTWISFVIAI